jgi:hypothetical protein
MPEQEAVLAITSGTGDMQAVLNLVWEHLLPALNTVSPAEVGSGPEELGRKLSSLALLPVQGQAASLVAAGVSGRKYSFEANEEKLESLSLDFSGEVCVLTLQDERGEHRVECGSGAWLKGRTTLNRRESPHVAASGAWTAEDSYVMKLHFYETPFCHTLTCRFTEDKLIFDSKANVAFGPTEDPQLVGQGA